jgi:hypothetical protein
MSNGGNGSARGVASETGAKARRDGGTEGGLPLALLIPQAAGLCLADRDAEPVCLVIDRGEIGTAERLWQVMKCDLAAVEMSIEADQRFGGARAVLLFARRDGGTEGRRDEDGGGLTADG